MSGTYQQNKISIYNWNAKNLERKNQINRDSYRRRTDWKNVCKMFRFILLE